jgi:hypothetical protein
MLQTVDAHMESGETATASGIARRLRHLAVIAIMST